MRHHFDTADRPRRVAKRLRSLLAEDGLAMGQSRALDTTAALYGYRDWQELSASVGAGDSSLDDAECPEDVASRRRDHHVAVVTSLGLPSVRAVAIVDALRPTGTRRRTPVELVHALADVLAAEVAAGFQMEARADGRRIIRLRLDGVFHDRPGLFDDRTFDEAHAAFVDNVHGLTSNFVFPEPPHPRIKKLYFNRYRMDGMSLLLANAYYWQPGER